MRDAAALRETRREEILDGAIEVFGRLGFRKAGMEDVAAAARISKQGLYLHFSSKEALFSEAMRKYLEDGQALVDRELAKTGARLLDRLTAAMDAWFGRHLSTFGRNALDIIDADGVVGKDGTDKYKAWFRKRLAEVLSADAEFARGGNICSAEDVAHALYIAGLTWKEERGPRAAFAKKMRLCTRVACQLA